MVHSMGHVSSMGCTMEYAMVNYGRVHLACPMICPTNVEHPEFSTPKFFINCCGVPHNVKIDQPQKQLVLYRLHVWPPRRKSDGKGVKAEQVKAKGYHGKHCL